MMCHRQPRQRPMINRSSLARHSVTRSSVGFGPTALGWVGLILLLSSVTSIAHAAKLAEYQKTQHFVDEAPEDQALIYVYRPQSNVGVNPILVFVDDRFVGINKGGSYFSTTVEPGKHVLWAKSFNIASIEVDLEAGRTYYLRIREAAALLSKSRAKLALVDAAKASERIQRCPLALPTAAGEARGAELITTHWQKARSQAKPFK